MPYDPDRYRRRSIRLQGYDYARAGAYFVTICVQGRECLFGDVADGEMRANGWGNIVAACWEAIPKHFPGVVLDAFVVMPNHLHGIIILPDRSLPGEVTALLRDDQGEGSEGAETAPLQDDRGEGREGAETAPLQDDRGEGREGAETAPLQADRGERREGAETALLQDDQGEGRGISLGRVVAYFKYQSTKRINLLRGMPGVRLWQRNYYDHIIRNDMSLQRIREYIANNPLQWHLDQLYPDNPSKW